MAKSNLLKEAIADAKAVRETALANARMRMEEAFTPRLQSMISAKLQNEIEGEDDEVIDEPVVDEPVVDEPVVDEPVVDEPVVDEIPAEEPVEEPVDVDVEPGAEAEVKTSVDEPVDIDDESGSEVDVEAPVEEPVEIETEPDVDIEVEPSEDEIEEEGYELDLESIIKELEDEANIDDEIDEPMFTEEGDLDDEELYESDNIEVGFKTKKDATPDLTATAPNAGGGEQVSPDLKKLEKNAIYEDEFEDEDEEINLDEILRELEEANLSASVPEEIPAASNPFETMNEQLKKKVSSLTKDLKEHRQVIKFLKSKLNEVNLLNAKLLFTSKLFKSNNMSNNEKMKVIESFDRAKTLREVKLVYSTIAESLTTKTVESSKRVINKITESIGGASKPVASTKPATKSKKIISEGIVSEEGAERLMKLAGIKK